MFPKPKPSLKPNTYAYESEPMVKATGFREYDARWLFGSEINLMGVEALGLGLGTLIHELGVKPQLVTGHDFRSYSASIKMALINGLIAAGVQVKDIGLALTPMAYFAQFDLDVPCVAMVTASHNDNGWTGVKMGVNRPLTFGPDEMARLKDIVLGGAFKADGRRRLRIRRRFSGALHRRPHQAAEAQAAPQSGVRLRQRHRRRLRAAGAGSDRLRGGAARLRARPHLPELQSEHRRHEDAARHARRGAGQQGRRRAWASTATATAAAWSTTRARRSSPTRSASCWRAIFPRNHKGATVRRRREIDRPVHDRSGADQERRQNRLLEDRPFLHEAPGQRDRRHRRLREVRATSSSTSRSAAAMTTG